MLQPRVSWFALALFSAIGSGVYAQSIGYVYPAGGTRGKTIEVIVGGQNIKETEKVHISGGGIKASVVKWYRPMTQGEYNAINMKVREKQDELEKAGKKASRDEILKMVGITEEQLKEMAIYEKRRADPKRQPNVQISEELTVRIQIAPDAAYGDREVRLISDTGMTNPLRFYVGQWREVNETEPNDITPVDNVHPLPVVVNGQIMPGDVDRFSFKATKGQKLVFHCAARAVIPYLADAVPGWFQAVLALYDEKGTELAYADSYGFIQDPVLFYEVPKDGNYIIEVHDSIYRGREDFVYRLTMGEIPFITGIFPLGGKTATSVNVELTGWNLPVNSLKVEPTFDRGRSLKTISVTESKGISNQMPFLVDTVTEVMEKEPNDTPETAQKLTGMVVVNGKIDKPGDLDYYYYEGGGTIVAEVFARRLYSPLDSVVRLTDPHGKTVAVNDDFEDKSWPLVTHHADSRLLTVSMGAHHICIGDAQGRGGPDYSYRLYIRPPRPDFDLRVTPASVSVRPGSCVPITVYAFRKDGFAEDIMVALNKAPEGFKLSGAWVPGGQDKCRMTLSVPTTAPKEPLILELDGFSSVRGSRVGRLAYPADAVTQAFAYQHLIPTKDWTISVTGAQARKIPCSIMDERLRIVAGGTTQMRVMPDKNCPVSELRFELSEPPVGITIQDPVPMGPGLVVPIKCDAEKVKLPLKGDLIFAVAQEHNVPAKGEKKATTRRETLGLLPAIPFEVLPGSSRK